MKIMFTKQEMLSACDLWLAENFKGEKKAIDLTTVGNAGVVYFEVNVIDQNVEAED